MKYFGMKQSISTKRMTVSKLLVLQASISKLFIYKLVEGNHTFLGHHTGNTEHSTVVKFIRSWFVKLVFESRLKSYLETVNMEFNPVTHVLFDMDGLILNTEDLYTVAFQNVVSQYGKDYTFDLKVKLMGLQTKETAEMMVSSLDLPITPEEFIKQTNKQFQKLFPDTEVLPGVRHLIEHLSKKNIPIGLATSSSKESYELKVNKRHKDLFSLFPYKTMGSSDPEVKNGKPHPDIFLVAASRFPDKPDPAKCLVFEDAVNGVKAARAAGMQVVMVPDSRLDKKLTTEATLVLKSLEDFKPELFGLPPFED